MISSAEVQQMIAQQQQAMAAQLDYSYQTSMGYMGGIGSYGMNNAPILPPMGVAGPSTPQGIPYMGHNEPGFSYGPRTGYGLGNRVGMGAVGAVNSSASLASTAISLSTMYGGYKTARLAGAGFGRAALGGALAGGPIGIMAGMAIEHGAANMYQGAQEQQAVYGVLGQNFNFVNGASRTGRGFSRQDAKSISDFTRELQSVPEMMTSMSELTRVMSQISQMGMMHGAKTAQEFNRKFKENINTLKEISKIMQTTMEESVQFMAQAKQSGFYSGAGQMLNTAQRVFTSGLTGMNQQQIGQLQYAGSQMSFATGGYRRSGANAALRTARQIGMAQEMGIISDDQIHELTGVGGAEGVAALSENLTGAAYRMARGGLGTAMSIAVAEQDKSGRFTGGVDQNMVDKIRSGGISKGELLSLARSKTRSRNAKISWGRQKQRLTSEMASSVGVEGMTMELEELLGGRGWDNPDVTNIVMQRYGVDERTASAIQMIGKNMSGIQSEIGKKAQIEGRRQAENAMRGEMSWEGMKTRFAKKMENTFSEPFRKLGADMSNAIGEYVDDFMDGLMDRYSVEITRSTANLVAGAMSGNIKSQQAISDLSGKIRNVPVNPMQASHSYLEGLMDLAGTRSNNYDKHEFLNSLPDKYVTRSGWGDLSQNAEQEASFRKAMSMADKGMFRKEVSAAYRDMGEAGDIAARGFKSFMMKNNSKLAEMGQVERLNFIRDEGSEYIYRLTEAGASPEEAIALLQTKSGTGSLVGAFNPGKYASDRYGTGTFADAPTLAKRLNASTRELSDKFGDQSSAALALLKKDSKERDLFLAASSGDKDAQKLLMENVPAHEKEALLRKYGVSDTQVDSIRGIYGGAGGQDVRKLAQAVQGDILQGSMGAEAAQLRRMGGDMADRLGKAGTDLFHSGANRGLESFISKLQGIDSPEKLIQLVGKGGSMSGDIRGVMDMVRGLKGTAREQALDVLGPAARQAINAEAGLDRELSRGGKKALMALREGSDDDIKEFIDSHVGKKGTLSKTDRQELVKMLSDRKFAGGLAQSGTVQGKDVENQKKLTEELTKFVEANSRFAQIVYQTVPGAREAAQQVQDSKPNMTHK